MKSVKKDDILGVKRVDFNKEKEILNMIKDFHDQSLVNSEDEKVIRLIVDTNIELPVSFYYNLKDLQRRSNLTILIN